MESKEGHSIRPDVDPALSVAVLTAPKRVYIDVSGGVVQNVSGTNDYEIIDWDNIEADPTRHWNEFDDETREYIKRTYTDDYKKFFAGLEKYSLADWQMEVANGDTVLGFAEWQAHSKERDSV